MQGYSVLKTIFDFLIDTGLIKQVFHSVEIVEDKDGVRFPAYPDATGELNYVGLDDTKFMNVYVRQLDDLRVVQAEKISSASVDYFCSIPHRVVFFNDNETRNQDDLLKKFIQFTFLPSLRLLKIIVDKEKLLQQETSPDKFKLDGKSFYCAIDFELLLRLQKNNCETEITCSNIPNPYCK